MPFTKQGIQLEERVPHLFTLTDFLDDSWTHRSYWEFAADPSLATGCTSREKNLIYGRLLVYDDTNVYGYARNSVHWSNAFQDGPYLLYARRRDASNHLWSQAVPIQVQAMVKAAGKLFIAGPTTEVLGKTVPTGGQQDALLLVYSADDGREFGRYQLTAPPRFDGMAAARGELYLALTDGSVVCMNRK